MSSRKSESSCNEHTHGFGLMHCIAVYPPRIDELRLTNIGFLKKHFNVPVGFSDHTNGCAAGLAALSSGAMFFEKHVTLDRSQPGPDHHFALEPKEMKTYINGIKNMHLSELEQNFLDPSAKELELRKSYMKSAHYTKDFATGHSLSNDDIHFVRPGTGLSPIELGNILGKTLIKEVKEGELIKKTDMR